MQNNNVKIVHCLRTFGIHGGEILLHNHFSHAHELYESLKAQPHFWLLYKDQTCINHFKNIDKLKTWSVVPVSTQASPHFIIETLKLIFFYPLVQMRLFKQLIRLKPTIIIAHGFYAGLACWFPALFFKNTKFIYMHHGNKSRLGMSSIFKIIYKPYQAICANSKTALQSLAQFFKGKPQAYIPNGINLSVFDMQLSASTLQPKSGFTFIAVGRLVPVKNYSLIIESFAEIIKSNIKAYLWILGDGSELKKLIRLTEKLNITEHVTFFYYQENILPFLKSADVFLHASLNEGTSLAVIEAMLASKPSVVLNSPGVVDCHIAGKTALVVENTANDFSNAMQTLINNPKLADEISNAARHYAVTNFTCEANTEKFKTLFELVIKS